MTLIFYTLKRLKKKSSLLIRSLHHLFNSLSGYLDPLVASSVHGTRNGRSLPRQGRDHLSQWGMGISVVFFTETTGSLRNPETRCTPSYVKYELYILTMYKVEHGSSQLYCKLFYRQCADRRNHHNCADLDEG